MRQLTSKWLKIHPTACLAGFSLLLALCLLSSGIAEAQQVITTAVSSGPNVIAITTYQGNVYYATATPGAIYKMTPSGAVTLIAGALSGGATGFTTNAPVAATSAAIAPGVNGLAFDANGNLFFSEPSNHQIREIPVPADSPSAVIITFDNSQTPYPGALLFHGGLSIGRTNRCTPFSARIPLRALSKELRAFGTRAICFHWEDIPATVGRGIKPSSIIPGALPLTLRGIC